MFFDEFGGRDYLTRIRQDIPEEERFLLRIKYGPDELSSGIIDPEDSKYFEKRTLMFSPTGMCEGEDTLYMELAQNFMLSDFEYVDTANIDGSTWMSLLRYSPDAKEFAKICEWGKLSELDWIYLLCPHFEEYSQYCIWEKISFATWIEILSCWPNSTKSTVAIDEFVKRYPISELTADQWYDVLAVDERLKPYFIEHNTLSTAEIEGVLETLERCLVEDEDDFFI